MSLGPNDAVVLVGHGAPARDCPRELVARLKELEAARRRSGGGLSAEERELDERVRHWPRTSQNDPYRAGLMELAERLKPLLGGARLRIAYNEFCAPTLQEVVGELIDEGAMRVVVVPSMLTPGGSHAEVEIPEAVHALREQYPELSLSYAWPFDLDQVAALLAQHAVTRGLSGEPQR